MSRNIIYRNLKRGSKANCLVEKYITFPLILERFSEEKNPHLYWQITQNDFLFRSGGFWDNPDYLDSSTSADRHSLNLVSFCYISTPGWIIDLQTLFPWSWWTNMTVGVGMGCRQKEYHRKHGFTGRWSRKTCFKTGDQVHL